MHIKKGYIPKQRRANMNLVILQGRLTRENELKHTKGGTAVVKNSIAVDRKMKKGETDFVNIDAFGKTAEFLATYTEKGNRITIEGRIETGSYEKEGKKVYTTSVIVNNVYPIDWKNRGEKKDEGIPKGFYPSPDTDEHLPF